MGIAVGGFDFDHSLAHRQDGNIERAAAEVVDGDGFVLLLVESVGQGGRGGLVDDAHHFEAGDLSRILGGLALGVIEIRWNRDHSLGHLAAQVGFGRFLQLRENHGGNLGRRLLLAIDVHPHVVMVAADHFVGDHLHFFVDFVIAAPHEPFDREYRVRGVGDGLSFRDLTDQALAGLGKRPRRMA